MSRDKLILQYSALNTPDLPQRIFNEIKSYIEANGIDNLPYHQFCVEQKERPSWLEFVDNLRNGRFVNFRKIMTVLSSGRNS